MSVRWLVLLAWAILTPQCAFAQFGNNGCNPSGTMLSQQSVTTSSVFTLSAPNGTRYITVALRTGASSSINYSYDGKTTPTTTATGNGNQLNAGQAVAIWSVSGILNFQAIAATGTTAIDVDFCN